MTIQELYDWAKAKDTSLLDMDISVMDYDGSFHDFGSQDIEVNDYEIRIY